MTEEHANLDELLRESLDRLLESIQRVAVSEGRMALTIWGATLFLMGSFLIDFKTVFWSFSFLETQFGFGFAELLVVFYAALALNGMRVMFLVRKARLQMISMVQSLGVDVAANDAPHYLRRDRLMIGFGASVPYPG